MISVINTLFRHLKTREYGLLFIIMLLAGTSVASSIPLVTLFLTKELGASHSIAGLFFLTSLVTPFMNIYTGKLSDRLLSRKPIIQISALLLAIGWTLIGFSVHVAMVFIFGFLFLQFLGTLNAQTFALIRDILERNQESKEATVSSTIRTGYSLGWTLGPVLGTTVAGILGYRAAFFMTALLFLLIFIPLHWIRVQFSQQITRKTAIAKQPINPWKMNNKRLLVFGGVCVLVLTGETVRLAYLPILTVDQLGFNVSQLGGVMSVAPLTELVVMPIAGILADRIGLNRMLLGGFVVGWISYIVFANSSELWHLYVGQILHAILIAIIFGLGVTYAQQLSLEEAGLASSVFFSAQSIAFLTGSVLGSFGVEWIGLPQMFYFPTLMMGMAFIIFIWNDRRR